MPQEERAVHLRVAGRVAEEVTLSEELVLMAVLEAVSAAVVEEYYQLLQI
jgi:hypothetical protein